jgi:prolyl-tRNA editing enzyme YbaK/EbsC (Cys-tRNA(Pro) deacylase)
MMSNDSMRASARRVQQALAKFGLDLKVQELAESTRTAAEAAASIGCQVGQIAKSLIFMTAETRQPVLVIASGSNRVNEKKIGSLVGEAIRKADADFVREKTGYAIGGVPPVGHAADLITFIDQDLMDYERIWAAAGTPFAVFELKPADLLQITDGKVIDIH